MSSWEEGQAAWVSKKVPWREGRWYSPDGWWVQGGGTERQCPALGSSASSYGPTWMSQQPWIGIPKSQLFTRFLGAASPYSSHPATAHLGSVHLTFGPLSTLLETICWGGLIRVTASAPPPKCRAGLPQPGLTTHVLEQGPLPSLPTHLPCLVAFIC